MAEESLPTVPRDIHFGGAGVQGIASGVALLSRLVASAYGPHGGRVMLERAFDTPLHVADAERICRDFALDDPLPDIGVRLVRELQLRTRRAAGDGAATATILFDTLLRDGLRRLAGGAEPRALAAGLATAARDADASLQQQTRQVRGTAQRRALALGIAGDPELADLLAAARDAAGDTGVVLVEPSRARASGIMRESGFRLPAGYASPLMAADTQNLQTRLVGPEIVVALDRVDARDRVLPLLERASATARPLLLVAAEVEGAALATLAANAVRRDAGAPVVAVRAPGHGAGREEVLADLAAATGAEPVADSRHLAGAGPAGLDAIMGAAGEVLVGREQSLIRDGSADPFRLRLRLDVIAAARAGWPTEHEREQLDRRRANLTGHTVLLRIGGETDPAAEERLHRAGVCLRGYEAALHGGILPGGGAALMRAAAAVSVPGSEWADPGRAMLCRALFRPAEQLLANAGLEPQARASVIDRAAAGRGTMAFPADDGRRDRVPPASARALRAALQGAATTAAMLLTASVVITDRD